MNEINTNLSNQRVEDYYYKKSGIMALVLAVGLTATTSVSAFASEWGCHCGNPSPGHTVGVQATHSDDVTYGFSWISCSGNSGSGRNIYTTVTIGGEQDSDYGSIYAQTNTINNDGYRSVYQTHGYY